MAEKDAKDAIAAAGGDTAILAEDGNDLATCMKDCTLLVPAHVYFYARLCTRVRK